MCTVKRNVERPRDLESRSAALLSARSAGRRRGWMKNCGLVPAAAPMACGELEERCIGGVGLRLGRASDLSRRVSEPVSNVSRTCLASRLQTAGEEREGGGKQEEDEEVAHAYYVCGSEEREREKNSALFRCRAPRVTGTPQCGSPPACSSAPVLGRAALTTTRSVIAALPSAAARRPARRPASRQSARTRCLRPRTNRSARGRRSCRQEHTSKAARALPKWSVPTASQESEQQPSLSPSGI